MKKNYKSFLPLLLCLILAFCIGGCGSNTKDSDLWANAAYTEDTEFGEGNVTIQAEVKVNENDITFTIHTDTTTLGDALLEHSLIAGDDGEYGLYVKEVNGIQADYDTDKAYWAFYKDGEYLTTGVDSANITDGEHYEIVYTQE